MSTGMVLTLVVMAVILLGAAGFIFANMENIQMGKKVKEDTKKVEKAEEVKEEK